MPGNYNYKLGGLTPKKANQRASLKYRARHRSTGNSVGRPHKYPPGEVFEKIQSIVSEEVEAQERRRSSKTEALFGVSNLQSKLSEAGIKYSRGATYNYLAARRKSSIEASRHHTGASVHFYKPQNNEEVGHIHSHYANAQAKNIHQLVEVIRWDDWDNSNRLVPAQKPITFISFDNKAKVTDDICIL